MAVTLTTLFYHIIPVLTGLIIIIIATATIVDSRVIMRREIAPTLQQNGPSTDFLQNNNNNNNINHTTTITQLTKLDMISPTENDGTLTAKKTTLKLVNDAREAGTMRESSSETQSTISDNSTSKTVTEESMPLKLSHPSNDQPKVEESMPLKLSHPSNDQPIAENLTTASGSLLEHNKPQLQLEDTNEIQISNGQKQPKFLNDDHENSNSTDSNRLNLPNTADVWTLASFKSISPRSNSSGADDDDGAGNNKDLIDKGNSSSSIGSNGSSILMPIKEKTLTDWTKIVQMGEVDKSVGNALTEDEEMLMTTTISSIIRQPVTTPYKMMGSSPTTTHSTITTTTSAEKGVLAHDMTTSQPLSSSSSSSSSQPLTFDNVESSTTTQRIDMQYSPNENGEKIQENKLIGNEESTTMMKSTTTTTTEKISLNEENTVNQTMEGTIAKMMKITVISTPAIALESTTEISLEEHQRMHEVGNGNGNVTTEGAIIEEKEKKKEGDPLTKSDKDKFQGGVEVNETTTTTTTTTTVKPSILTTNVEEVINLPSISTTTTTTTTPTPTTTISSQPSPDVSQIGTKSNLETPTATTALATNRTNIEEATKTTAKQARIEITPTTNWNSSSAVTSETSRNVDIINARNDSLNNVEVPEITTTISITTIETAVTKETPQTTTRVPTTTTGTTQAPTVSTAVFSIDDKQATTTTAPTTTTPIPVTSSKDNFFPSTLTSPTPTKTPTTTASTADEPQRNKTEMSTTETPLTNFIDDSTITTTTTANTIIRPASNSTISPTTTTTSTPTIETIETTTVKPSTLTSSSSSSGPILSVQTTNTDELQSDYTTKTTTTTTETTEENPTVTPPPSTTTTTQTTTSKPIVSVIIVESTTKDATTISTTISSPTTFVPATTPTTTTTTTIPETTTIETIIEMVPIVKQTPKTTTQLEGVPSNAMPISTTLNPSGFNPGGDGSDMASGILQAQPPKSTPDNPETDVNVVIAISVSVIGVVALILLVAFLYLMRKRQKATSYGQRCRPVSLDAYSLDNVSVLGSVRRKGAALRASKRSYGNAAFDDPSLRHNVLQTAADLAKFVERRSSIFEEFRDVPQIFARPEEIPVGCENKNRYANVIPLPETRVILQRRNDDDTSEYINANYVRGPKDAPNYYIACQAPLDSTVQDFWRMIWEQQSRVIIQATDLNENGAEKCAEYLPPSVTLDNHTSFGDFQVTLKNREVKEKYAISTIMLKNTITNTSREMTHYWYKWPEIGVPSEEAPIIAMLLEARSSLKSYALEVTNELKEKHNSINSIDETESGDIVKVQLNNRGNGAGPSSREINGNISEKARNISRNQGPLTIHCSPGTGRTGTIIACDIAIRSLETTKTLDIPQIVYYIRRGRASAVQTKEQYEFIYKVSNVYAMKITNVPNDN